jgi:hypothetical protein
MCGISFKRTSFLLEIDKTRISIYLRHNCERNDDMVTVTELAQEKIAQALKENKNETKAVRVFLYGGG